MLPPSRQPSLLRSGWSAAKKVIMITGNDGDDGTGHDFDGEVDDSQGCQLRTSMLTKTMASFNKVCSVLALVKTWSKGENDHEDVVDST